MAQHEIARSSFGHATRDGFIDGRFAAEHRRMTWMRHEKYQVVTLWQVARERSRNIERNQHGSRLEVCVQAAGYAPNEIIGQSQDHDVALGKSLLGCDGLDSAFRQTGFSALADFDIADIVIGFAEVVRDTQAHFPARAQQSDRGHLSAVSNHLKVVFRPNLSTFQHNLDSIERRFRAVTAAEWSAGDRERRERERMNTKLAHRMCGGVAARNQYPPHPGPHQKLAQQRPEICAQGSSAKRGIAVLKTQRSIENDAATSR